MDLVRFLLIKQAASVSRIDACLGRIYAGMSKKHYGGPAILRLQYQSIYLGISDDNTLNFSESRLTHKKETLSSYTLHTLSGSKIFFSSRADG